MIINWFITPKHHILKGDVVLSADELLERNMTLSKKSCQKLILIIFFLFNHLMKSVFYMKILMIYLVEIE